MRRDSDIPGNEVANGRLELPTTEVGEQGGALASGGVSQHHEEEAHHGQTAVLDLAELHVVPLLLSRRAVLDSVEIADS